MIKSVEEYAIAVNKTPQAHEIRKNDDGSEYIPISIIQEKLDDIFNHLWSWEYKESRFTKSGILGKGLLSYYHPVNGLLIFKSGTAFVAFSGNMKLDYPRCEAMALLNASKKAGKIFGRDLNR